MFLFINGNLSTSKIVSFCWTPTFIRNPNFSLKDKIRNVYWEYDKENTS